MITKTDFITLLKGAVADTVGLMSKEQLRELFGDCIANTKDFDQRHPYHCYTLLDHMLHATDALECKGLPEEDIITLKAAMFFHDCGKPSCAKQKEDRFTFHGHTQASAILAQPLLEQIGFSCEETERICFFIEYHDILKDMRLGNDTDEVNTDWDVISYESGRDRLTSTRKAAVQRISYYPTDGDLMLLPRVYKADICAQAEKVYKNGVLRTTREHNLHKADIIAEYVNELAKNQPEKYICVFGASSNNIDEEYINEAFRLGVCMVKEKFGLVFGAGLHGLMGAVAEGIYSAGGKAYGVIPEKLHRPGIASPYCSELFVTATMHERKAKMEELSSAFIALPGGYGTFEELLEIITLKQLGYMDMPIVIMNVNGYYDDLLNMFEYATDEGFADEKYLSLFHESTTPEDALRYIKEYKPSEMPDKIGEVLKKMKRQ